MNTATIDRPNAAAIAPRIGALLGALWRVAESDGDRAVIACSDGRRITLWTSRNHSKIEIHGSFPTFADGRIYSPSDHGEKEYRSIACSLARGTDAIARDVGARFLPGYSAAYRRAQDTILRADDARARAIHLARELADLCGERGRVADSNVLRTYPRALLYTQRVHGEAEVIARDDAPDVNMKLSGLTADQARRILAIAAETTP